MKVKLSDISSVFKVITLSEIENIDTRNVIDEIFDNYSFGEFNLIGEWEDVNQSYKYLQFKLKELIHNRLPLIADLFPNGENLLKGLNGSVRSVEYNGKEKMDNSSFSQSENAPINNNIEDIQTPIIKNAGKGNTTRSFENRIDKHDYTSIDEMIKKYDFLTRERYMTLYSFCEKNFIIPLIDEFNTMY